MDKVTRNMHPAPEQEPGVGFAGTLIEFCLIQRFAGVSVSNSGGRAGTERAVACSSEAILGEIHR
jgi:hypothetical protein